METLQDDDTPRKSFRIDKDRSKNGLVSADRVGLRANKAENAQQDAEHKTQEKTESERNRIPGRAGHNEIVPD